MFVSKKKYKKLLAITEELFEHVWDHADFRILKFLDQNERQIDSNLTMDKTILKHWTKYHELRAKFYKIKQ